MKTRKRIFHPDISVHADVMPSGLEEATEAVSSPPVSLNTGSGSVADVDQNKPNATKAKQCKSFKKNYTAEQVMKALADTQGGMSIKKAAVKWNVPRSSLQVFHRKGTYEPNCRPGPSSILTKTEEGLLTEWMIEMCRRGIPNNLLDSVQTILMTDRRPTPFINGRPGRGWFSAFLKRNPKLAERNAESISRGRGALTEGCIRGWFADATKFFAENKCEYILKDNTRQYNADETGFQLDPKTGRVLAPRGEVVYTESGAHKEQISVLITTRADGKVMTSCIVYPYKRGIPKSIIDNIPSGFCAARSDSGWMTSEVFYEYLANTFIPELAKQRKLEKNLTDDEELLLTDADWVVLWVDGYSSHLTIHTSKVCELNKIVLYCFKAHASHICQPNDVGPFKPLKAEWKSAVTAWRLLHPYEQLTRVSFAPLLAKAIENLNPVSIISGYKATGLYPFDPDAIHYERLTSTNSAKFDESAFAPAEETDIRIALRCIESILGKETVNKYSYAIQTSSDDDLPQISAFDIWKFLKELTSSGGPVENADMARNLSQCCGSSTGVENELLDSPRQTYATAVKSPYVDVTNEMAVSTSIDTETTHSGTALIQCAARKAIAGTTNGLLASTLEQIGARQSLTSLTQSAASTAVIMPANVTPAVGPLENANIEWHSTLQQCGYSADTRNSQIYQCLPQLDNQPWQQAAIVMDSSPGPYLSSSMILDDTDISATTLLNLDLSMCELSGISEEPLQQDQSLATSTATRPVINGPADTRASPLLQPQSAPELNDLQSTSGVVLEDNGSPIKAKRGIPVWYNGKVSPAFAEHIFWPSPPKRKKTRVAHELFPASASTATWRELYKQKRLRLSGKKKASTPRGDSSLSAARKKLGKTTPLGSVSQDTSETEIPACPQENSKKAKPARKRRSCSKQKLSKETAPKPDHISETVDVECYVCCGLFSASNRGEKRWIECNNCGRWAHEICIDISPASNETFCCDFCS